MRDLVRPEDFAAEERQCLVSIATVRLAVWTLPWLCQGSCRQIGRRLAADIRGADRMSTPHSVALQSSYV